MREELGAIIQTLNKQDLCVVCLSALASCRVCDTPGCRACVCGECLIKQSKTKGMKCFRCNKKRPCEEDDNEEEDNEEDNEEDDEEDD